MIRADLAERFAKDRTAGQNSPDSVGALRDPDANTNCDSLGTGTQTQCSFTVDFCEDELYG